MLSDVPFSSDGEVTIAGSVATGLENVAADEIQEKIPCSSGEDAVKIKQGRVYIRTTGNSLAAIHGLRSLDRLYLIVKRIENYVYKETKEETYTDLTNLAHNLQWSEIIKFWFYNRKYCKGRLRQEDLSKKSSSHKIPKMAEGNSMDLSNNSNNVVDSKPPEKMVEEVDSNPLEVDGAIPVTAPDGTLIRFRVSTNRVGKKQPITSPEASYRFGGEIQDITDWKVDLSNYNLEIMFCLGEKSLEVAVALTLQSLHRRNISHFGVTTLRATTAYCMLRLANIQPGDIVIDPMCGSGAIPLEGALEWPHSFHIGGDIANTSIKKCNDNVKFIDKNPSFVTKRSNAQHKNLILDMFRWNVTCLPLKTDSADVIVSDLPFGKRIGSKTDNRKLYPALLKELGRVTKRETGRACLLTQDKRTIKRALDGLARVWKIQKNSVHQYRRLGSRIIFT